MLPILNHIVQYGYRNRNRKIVPHTRHASKLALSKGSCVLLVSGLIY